MDRRKAFHYRDRAESFLKLMRLGANSDIVEGYLGEQLVDYEDATALLAVHASIAFADAVLIHLTGERCAAQNHKEAVRMLRRACGRRELGDTGIRHFTWLLAHKDDFSYLDRRVPSDDVKQAVDHTEKFTAWVYNVLPDLGEQQQ